MTVEIEPMTAVDKSAPRVRQMFGEIASRYDFLNHLLSLNVDRYWRWQAVRCVPPQRGMKILDMCTGTGDLALAYHKAAQGAVDIIGADFCHEMLTIGQRKAQMSGKGESDSSETVDAGSSHAVNFAISFIEADAMRIPLDDNQFDIVAVAFGLRNVADTDAGLAELVRVCAAGGQVAVLEFSTPQWQPFKAIYGWYFRHILPRVGQLLARNAQSAYNYLPESVGEFPQGEQLAQQMRAAGLSDVWYRGLTLGVATLYVGKKSS